MFHVPAQGDPNARPAPARPASAFLSDVRVCCNEPGGSNKYLDGFTSRGVDMRSVDIEDKGALHARFPGAAAFHQAAAAHV